MVEKTTLKMFLTSGITLTVKEDEVILVNEEEYSLEDLGNEIARCVENKENLEFDCKIKHEYQDGEEVKEQEVLHHYYVPCDKISWYMIESI